eukprot:s1436_g20.t1
MERASDPPLAQRAVALSSRLGALLDLHGELHTELRLLDEQRILFPEVQEALTTASQAILAAASQLRDRRDDMNAIVERQQLQRVGASQRIRPSPTLSTRNLQRHDQSQESQGRIPEDEEVTQSAAGTGDESLVLAIAPAPCAKARITSTHSLAPDNRSSPGALECKIRPMMTMVERSLLFIARAESAPGGA